MLGEYQKSRTHTSAHNRDTEKLQFAGVGKKDVYNPSAPFKIAVKKGSKTEEITVLAGRVESRHSETDTQVRLFSKSKDGKWRPIAGAPAWDMQDPFVTKIGKTTVIGGVKTFPNGKGGLSYKTVFYKGESLEDLAVSSKAEPFAAGPNGMKDIRLFELDDGKIAMLTRPQGGDAGPGKIAYKKIDSLDQLNAEEILSAKMLTNLFTEGEWGGANELSELPGGRVGVLGHVARFGPEGERHYYPMSFVLDPKTGEYGPMKILLERKDLGPLGETKRPGLEDVLFSGGLKRLGDNSAELFVGAGDAETYKTVIPDPFADYR